MLEDSVRGRWLRTFSPLVAVLNEEERQAIRKRFPRPR